MSQTSSNAEFKYDDLEEPVVIQLKKIACAIGNHTRSGSKKILAIGRALLDAKQPLKHGQFHGWVVSQCGFSIRTAERYMCAALFLKDKYDTVSHLQPSTIYRLSAKTMPPSTAERVLARLTEEPALSDIDVNALIDQFLPVKEPVPIAPSTELPSALIRAWLEASPSDRRALLNLDREAFASGAWQLMSPEEQAAFLHERRSELASPLADITRQRLRDVTESTKIVRLFYHPQDESENAGIECIALHKGHCSLNHSAT